MYMIFFKLKNGITAGKPLFLVSDGITEFKTNVKMEFTCKMDHLNSISFETIEE